MPAQNMYRDIPVAIAVTLAAVVPTVICRQFRRWQGVLMPAIYIAYLVTVTVGCDRYMSLLGL